jgi:type IV secretory pathway ATPase VirB11/archaellum biosynthesis ATPase
MPDDEKDEQPDLPDDDAAQPPDWLPSLPGRVVSAAGMVERIVSQFNEEHGDDSLLLPTTTDVERRMLLRDVAEYVFGIESVKLSLQEQAALLQRAYSEIFGYGPLDALFTDDRITTIAFEGVKKIAVRYKPGEDLVKLDPIFEDVPHLRQILERLLREAGIQQHDDLPAVETGVIVHGRAICINAALPPFAPEFQVDMRLHPVFPRSLNDLVGDGFLTEKAAQFLQALAQSQHGFVIVGETESGKTTLLTALAQMLPNPSQLAAVERAGELRLSADARRFTVQWATDDKATQGSFAHQVQKALAAQPDCLLLDEIRADEPDAIAPLLAENSVPRQIWAFRGTADAKRLKSALAMLARMTDPTNSEPRVMALYERLPFVIIVKRAKGKIELREIGERRISSDKTYADYVELFVSGWEGIQQTGKRPIHLLNLSDDFWG